MTNFGDTHAIGSYIYDPQSEELRDSSGSLASLRPQTRRVLAVLLARRGQTVSKQELMDDVWADTHVTDDSLVQCISEIRKALGTRDGKLLVTIPREGYRLLCGDIQGQIAEKEGRHPSRYLKIVAVAFAMILAVTSAIWLLKEPSAKEARVLVVLPFTNISGDPGQDYFSIGLAEDLRTDLSKVSALTVLSRSSTMAYRRSGAAPEKLASEFGVSHLVEGSVRRSGDHLRISVQLVNAMTGLSIWAERYDREPGDLFQVQDDLRARIISALAVRLAPGEKERMLAGGTTDIPAYDLMLKGRDAEAALDRGGVMRAITYYAQAIAADPEFGEAHARLANMYDFAARYGWSVDTKRDQERALNMAERAVQISPKDPFAHWTYGRILSRLNPGDAETRQRAVEAVKTAIELDRNDADAYAFISLLHIGDGQPKYARLAIDEAFRLNREPPSWYIQNRGIISYMEGDTEAAISDFESAADQNPTAPFTRLWLAAAYALVERIDDAQWQIEEAITLGSPNTVSAALSANPIFQYPQYLKAYADGLRLAGLPD